jgi:hypothetical protein
LMSVLSSTNTRTPRASNTRRGPSPARVTRANPTGATSVSRSLTAHR